MYDHCWHGFEFDLKIGCIAQQNGRWTPSLSYSLFRLLANVTLLLYCYHSASPWHNFRLPWKIASNESSLPYTLRQNSLFSPKIQISKLFTFDLLLKNWVTKSKFLNKFDRFILNFSEKIVNLAPLCFFCRCLPKNSFAWVFAQV